MADDLKVAIPEKGEVLIEWGDRKEVVSLPNATARKLDLALPGKLPGESGIMRTLRWDVTEYPMIACEMIIKAAFGACEIRFTDEDWDVLCDEAGLATVGSHAVMLLRPTVMGKKSFLEWLVEYQKWMTELIKTMLPQPSPGDAGSASP